MDIRSQLLQGASATDLARRYGLEVVRDEIEEMISHDLADRALNAAISLRNDVLIQMAARVILCSGSYGEGANTLAKQHSRA
ncbi:MAG: hypothetical protein EXS46_01315 [Candidatus Taylorbacteria bacterium]|nr:hypothetical protein [Candidatus Taylorbacteria bacterium]